MPDTATPDPFSLVVPTARLAAALRRRDARQRRGAGADVWAALDVLGLGAWVTRASAAGRCDGRLPAFAVLGQEQAQALWTSVITTETADEQGRPLALRPAQSEALARLMAEAEDLVFAWDLGAAWRAPVPLTFEQQLARAWHKGFRERCRALGVGSRTMLLEACVARGVALASPHDGARGFAAAGPVLRGLLPSPVADTERGKVTADYRVHASLDDECDAALDWARAARAEGEDGGIALVCVDTRSVDAVLARARRWQLAAGQAVGAPADLNAPLARLPTAPLVEHALLLLQSLLRVQPMDAAALVTSPFIAGARTEFGPRARLAARLQAERPTPLTLAELYGAADAAGCAALVTLLDGLKSLSGQATGRREMSGWVEFVTRWLAGWAWSGGEGLTAQERAAFDAWHRALDTVAALDLVLPRQSFAEALARLRAVTGGITDSERLAPDAIEILSLEEAAVLQPAQVWVLGLHDAAWPPVPASNPLLPPALLKRAGVPGSDAAADARRAQQLLDTLVRGARRAVLSYAQFDGDTPRRPSGALAWPASPVAPAPSLFACWRPNTAPALLEPAPEDAPVPWSGAATARGGTGILAAQAQCAFRAFALYRLLAEEVEDAAPGIDPRLRGEIAHAAMAALWQRLRTQAAAQRLTPMERDEAIAEAVDAALDEVLAERPQFDLRQRALEARRLQRLLTQSLEIDLARPPFEVVAIEAQHRLVLGGLPLSMRVDRVDRLEDGAELILDYKTGRVQRKDWALPRPVAPQLLAYALARDAVPLGGIGYAQLRPGDCQLVTEPKTLPGGAAPTDPREAWRAELTRLGAAFVAGRAELDPRDGAKTCERCGLQALCRVHELARHDGEEDAPDEA